MIGTPLEINAVEPGDVIPWDCPYCGNENEYEIGTDLDTIDLKWNIECIHCEEVSRVHPHITIRLDFEEMEVERGRE